MNYSIRLVVAPLSFFILTSLLFGCATAEHGRRITPDQITWIQKGVTTRTEVVQKLGGPMSEVPDWGG
jgi:outer membrane protein assembly factor BamE (lipoprotein component of BamABCDE complex)